MIIAPTTKNYIDLYMKPHILNLQDKTYCKDLSRVVYEDLIPKKTEATIFSYNATVHIMIHISISKSITSVIYSNSL